MSKMAKKKPFDIHDICRAISRDTPEEDLTDILKVASDELDRRQRLKRLRQTYDPLRKCDNFRCPANRMGECISDKTTPAKCPRKCGYWKPELDKYFKLK